MLYINSVQFLVLEEKYMDNLNEVEMLTPKQVEKIYQIPQHTLAVWRYTDKDRTRPPHLPWVKVGRKVLYPKAELDIAIRNNMHGLSEGEQNG